MKSGFFVKRSHVLPAGLDIQFHGTDHVLGFENRIELLFRENAVLEHQLVHTAAGLERLFSDLGRILICLLYTSDAADD